MLDIPSSTFYGWYDLYLEGGLEALRDRSPKPKSVWNRVPDDKRDQIIDFALENEDLTPRELAVKFTDTKRYFISESTVYRLLKEQDLIASPAFVVIKAAEEFKDKTTAINQLWQTDFTYLKVIGWGWFYLSTILDDYSRYIISWKLCTTMKAGDVTDTLELALAASGCDQATVLHKPRLLSDNGSSYVAGDLADWLEEKGMDHVRGAPFHLLPDRRCLHRRAGTNPRQNRALASDHEEPRSAGALLLARRSGTADRSLRPALQPPPLPREPEQRHAVRCLLR